MALISMKSPWSAAIGASCAVSAAAMPRSRLMVRVHPEQQMLQDQRATAAPASKAMRQLSVGARPLR
jgi:hypothetical protein